MRHNCRPPAPPAAFASPFNLTGGWAALLLMYFLPGYATRCLGRRRGGIWKRGRGRMGHSGVMKGRRGGQRWRGGDDEGRGGRKPFIIIAPAYGVGAGQGREEAEVGMDGMGCPLSLPPPPPPTKPPTFAPSNKSVPIVFLFIARHVSRDRSRAGQRRRWDWDEGGRSRWQAN